jgi:chemosensory pili system protein ChpA (sensor histidine kinase/response regulator)
MAEDKEFQIRLQFLDEAQDYLNTIEGSLLGLADREVDVSQINAALRAAHSIKGGAAMMGFQTLSDLSHRLEDAFKVLRVQGGGIAVDAELERLLLFGVDCLHQVIDYDRQGIPTNPLWLESKVETVFARLHERLGDPDEEDASSMLATDEGQNIIPVLFESEVEGCLQRLETVLDLQDPRLKEEVEILAQELGGLGEMLALPAFVQLCHSIEQHLAQTPDQVEAIARMALHEWRRSQALILAGQMEVLPTSIGLQESTPLSPAIAIDPVLIETLDDQFNPFLAVEATSSEAPDNIWIDASEDVSEHSGDRDLKVTEVLSPEIIAEMITDSAWTEENLPEAEQQLEQTTSDETQVTDFRVLEEPVSSFASPPESTVRVPVKQLDLLNDFFGELTIERNRLNLQIKRLQGLIQVLSSRVRTLDHSNVELRTIYDRISLQSSASEGSQSRRLLEPIFNPQVAEPLVESDPFSSSVLLMQTNVGSEFDALEMDHYGNVHSIFQEIMETIVQIQEVTGDVNLELDETEQTSRDLTKTSKQMQTSLTQLRMRPLSDVVDRFPRALRELSLQYNKPVQLNVYGANTLVDRYILEALNDPLMHILRNAFDHGIEDAETRKMNNKPEEGLIEIRAFHRSNRTVIQVSDDGAGISLNKIRAKAQRMGLDEVLLANAREEELLSLIFEPGFSTADRVTALSGRGVGMDVVRNKLMQIRGDVKVETQAGQGTRFTITVPFTLSVTRVLLAESNSMILAFPTDVVEEMFLLQSEQIVTALGSEVFDWNGQMVQLIRLGRWLQFNAPRHAEGLETPPSINAPAVLMLRQNNQLVGLQVDRCWGEQEVAIRQVEGHLRMPSGFTNCTILGDGRVVPLVNVPELLHWIASSDRTQIDEQERSPFDAMSDRGAGASSTYTAVASMPVPVRLKPASPLPSVLQKSTVLVVDDSINVRRLLALTLEKAGYDVVQAKDGQDALEKLEKGLQVHAVICDIEMPRLDGFGFLAKLKVLPLVVKPPVLMLTSRSGNKHRQLATTLGAAAYFSKPYNEHTLLHTLENVISSTSAALS